MVRRDNEVPNEENQNIEIRMENVLNTLSNAYGLVINKMEATEVRRAGKDDRNREEMKNLFLNQIDDTNSQRNYEREKSVTDTNDLMKRFEKLDRKIEDREVEHKEEIRRQTLRFYRMFFYSLLVLFVGLVFGMVKSNPFLTTFIILMGLYIVNFVKRDFYGRR